MPDLAIDHVIVGIGDLEKGIGLLTRLTGVTPERGGRHPGRGTQNALLSLGPHVYLEIMAPIDGAAPGMELLAGLQQPTPIGWAIRTRDLDATVRRLRAAGFRVADPRDGSRVRPDGRQLQWRTATLEDFPGDFTPFLIEWGAATPHPAGSSPAGCTLAALEIRDAAADRLARLVKELGLDVAVRPAAAPLLRLTLRCPTGLLTLPVNS
jgi:hypothetical protein